MSERKCLKLFLLIAVIAPFIYGSPLFATGQQVPFNAVQVSIEVNNTDQTAAIQIVMDGPPCEKVIVKAPNGKFFGGRTRSALGSLGAAHFEFESGKVSLTQMRLTDFLAMFPAGVYGFKGKGLDGSQVIGTATLSANIPDSAVIESPTTNQVVDPLNLIFQWSTVHTPVGIKIQEYQIVIRQQNSTNEFRVSLPFGINTVRIPGKFLVPASTFTAEIHAIDIGGNQSVSSVTFSTP